MNASTKELRKFIFDVVRAAPGANMKSDDLVAAIEDAGLTKSGWQRDAKLAGLCVKHIHNDFNNCWLWYVPNLPD